MGNTMLNEKKKDLTCLGENLVYETDFAVTGINLNEIIVGPTGSGKSFSTAYPRLLHTYQSSVVVPVSKKAIREAFIEHFAEKGYKTETIDFVHPERSDVGYDPMDYIKTDQDAVQVARNLVFEGARNPNGVDPYWQNSAVSMLAAIILLVKTTRKNPSFADVIMEYKEMEIEPKDRFTSSLDLKFVILENSYPGNMASLLWKTVKGLAMRTVSCIISTLNASLDKIFSPEILASMKLERKLSFTELGKKRCALFIVTSPLNASLNTWINLMYADMFRVLFAEAEERTDSRLEVPVHIVCDDFACSGRIERFDEYISIFRAAGISVSLLLQSESQLTSIYGEEAATTIINNCDTYVFLGTNDYNTAKSISKRVNKPLDKVMSMPLERVIVFRRGAEPVISRRYQTLEDPAYIEMTEKHGNEQLDVNTDERR